jgi:hypothetical protein
VQLRARLSSALPFAASNDVYIFFIFAIRFSTRKHEAAQMRRYIQLSLQSPCMTIAAGLCGCSSERDGWRFKQSGGFFAMFCTQTLTVRVFVIIWQSSSFC